eukprot:2265115-Amphidinium_carterae.1
MEGPLKGCPAMFAASTIWRNFTAGAGGLLAILDRTYWTENDYGDHLVCAVSAACLVSPLIVLLVLAMHQCCLGCLRGPKSYKHDRPCSRNHLRGGIAV